MREAHNVEEERLAARGVGGKGLQRAPLDVLEGYRNADQPQQISSELFDPLRDRVVARLIERDQRLGLRGRLDVREHAGSDLR
jgi:hypothetical protein